MVDTDQCLMKVVEPMTIWIMPIGYEVSGYILDAYSQHFLIKSVDTNLRKGLEYTRRKS